MTYSPDRHHLPAPLVAADEPLSADVQRRSWEALQYLWQVTTGTETADGKALSSPQGHTHDGIRDQTLTADSKAFTGWPCGHVGTVLVVSSDQSPLAADPIFTPRGRWTQGPVSGVIEASRGLVEVPYAVSPAPVGDNAQVTAHILVEHGTANPGGSVTVTVTIDGQIRTAGNALAVAGLELIQVGPWAASSMPTGGGGQEMLVQISSAKSPDRARVWSGVLVAS